jgi:hypothetical protein
MISLLQERNTYNPCHPWIWTGEASAPVLTSPNRHLRRMSTPLSVRMSSVNSALLWNILIYIVIEKPQEEISHTLWEPGLYLYLLIPAVPEHHCMVAWLERCGSSKHFVHQCTQTPPIATVGILLLLNLIWLIGTCIDFRCQVLCCSDHGVGCPTQCEVYSSEPEIG